MRNILSYRKQIDIQLRMFHINQQQQYGFIINTSYHWTLSKRCADLHKEGFDLLGLEVLKIEEMPESKDVLAANEEFIGEIKELQNDNAVVSTNEGDIVVPLNELTLRKTTYNIKSYLTHLLGESQSEVIISKVKFDEQNRLNNKKERTEINRIAQLISLYQDKTTVTYKNSDGFYYTVNSTPFNSESSFTLKNPPFIFDHAATKVENRNADAGLNNFGPWDAITFDCKSPHIVGICAKRNRGSFTEFLAKLINGDPTSQWFKKGIQKKYDLNNVTYEVFDIPNCDFVGYNNVISHMNTKPDLIIMEIPESFKRMKIEENPYYRLKAKLLTLEIPFQFIVESKVRHSNDALLNTIGLQIYAKLGGTPWVLPSARSIDRELIVGVGNSIIRNNSFKGSEKNRVVGITTFFSSDGQYLLSNKAKDVPYSEYFNELLRTLKEAFAHLKELQGWKDNDTIRLIFHIFKPIKNIEFEVVCKLMESFPEFKIQFAFVTISKKHPYKLYETSQSGVIKGNKKIGEFTPLRGANIILDSTSCLVQMLGANEIKTDRHGASSPILIKIRRPQGNFDSSILNDMLFTDIQYISQQIFSFTYLSWRSFLPKELPATMLYSDLIANLLGRLRKINGWQPDILNFKLKQKKMVSLEERISYLNKIQQIPKIKLFSDLLNGKHCVTNIANVDVAYIGFIDSISNNNEQKFIELYNDYSRKKTSVESLWINDDFLIFVLILGIIRYQIDRTWIKGAISARTTKKPEHLSINKTFSNILDDNFQSNDNLYEIVIVLQDFLNLAISTEHLDSLYKKISNNIDLYSSQNDFLVCLSIKAMDIIIISKSLPDNKEITNMRDFVALFQKRVITISKIIYILILTLIIILMFIFWEKYAELLNAMSLAFGLLGVGLLTFIEWVQKKINEFLLSTLGYSKIFKIKKKVK